MLYFIEKAEHRHDRIAINQFKNPLDRLPQEPDNFTRQRVLSYYWHHVPEGVSSDAIS